jgi:hypothetical protein
MKINGAVPLFLAGTLLASATLAAEVRVEGGTLQVDAGMAAGRVVIAAPAALVGGGRVEGDLEVAGTVAPQSPSGGLVGTQSVSGAAVFLSGSRFLCDAASHTSLDRLDVTGPVTGVCQVVLTALPGAVPVGQVVIQGSGASDYASFRAQDAWTWRLAPTGGLDLAVTHLRGDTDGDGLPDWWEMLYFGGSRTAALPLADGDNDGMNNQAEYAANTDPARPDSILRLTSLSRPSTNSVVVQWTTAPGRRYGVERMTNLPDSACTTVSVVTVYGMPEHCWTNGNEAGTSVFYRIKVEENGP